MFIYYNICLNSISADALAASSTIDFARLSYARLCRTNAADIDGQAVRRRRRGTIFRAAIYNLANISMWVCTIYKHSSSSRSVTTAAAYKVCVFRTFQCVKEFVQFAPGLVNVINMDLYTMNLYCKNYKVYTCIPRPHVRKITIPNAYAYVIQFVSIINHQSYTITAYQEA